MMPSNTLSEADREHLNHELAHGPLREAVLTFANTHLIGNRQRPAKLRVVAGSVAATFDDGTEAAFDIGMVDPFLAIQVFALLAEGVGGEHPVGGDTQPSVSQ